MKKKFNYILLLIVSILVLYYALKDNYIQILNQIFSIDILYLLISLILIIIFWILKSYILYLNTKNFNDNFKFNKSILITLKTQFFDGVTPFSSGGQPFQIFMLNKEKISVSKSTSIVISNSFIFQVSRTIVCLFALLINAIYNMVSINSVAFTLIIIGIVVNSMMGLLYYLLMFSKKINRIILNFLIIFVTKFKIVKYDSQKLKESFANFDSASKLIINNRNIFIKMIIINILAFIFLSSIPFMLFIGMGYNNINFIELFSIVSFAQIVGSFIPVPGSTGGIEYFFIMYTSFIISKDVTGVMILWRFITYYLQLIIGAILVNKNK